MPLLVLDCGGGVVAGMLLARLYLRLTAAVTDIPISIVLQFISTFAVWILAERVGLSAIITVVCYAMTLARHVPARMDASSRIASYVVWEVMVFVLNALAFVLIGLQLRGDRHATRSRRVARLRTVRNRRVRGGDRDADRLVDVAQHDRAVADPPLRCEVRAPCISRPSAAVSSSPGAGCAASSRLAAALALPENFPLPRSPPACALSVVLATLVVQGLTLRWLIERVSVRDDGLVEREIGIARAETARAALRALESDDSPPALALREEYETRLRAAENRSAGAEEEDSSVTALLHRRVSRRSARRCWISGHEM